MKLHLEPPASVQPVLKALSKSKLMAFRQCPRRLWLEVHRPGLQLHSEAARARFDAGNEVGRVARSLYDPGRNGVLIDAQQEGCAEAVTRTTALLASSQPIFEAGFCADGTVAFVDAMLPEIQATKPAWHLVEVKSSTSVTEHHRDDVAIQAFAARRAGVPLLSVSVAHVDTSWVYLGAGDYTGLLREEDVTAEAFGRELEVQDWVNRAHEVVSLADEPVRDTGPHCTSPFECGFLGHCSTGTKRAEFPVTWLPRVQSAALRAHLANPDIVDMRDVPDALLNPTQLRVKQQTLAGTAYFDTMAAARCLQPHHGPLHFLDFEAIHFPVPRWAGTRPYEQIPFQFSLHVLTAGGELREEGFLDLGDADPSASFAEALVRACGTSGTIFVYNASFESARLKELGSRFPGMQVALQRINARIVDLLPVVRAHFYHPMQEGSWSLKKVLPALVPTLHHAQLEGVQDGAMAMEAYLEAICRETAPERKAQIERQLRAYCSLDTYAMVRIWQVLSGQWHLSL